MVREAVSPIFHNDINFMNIRSVKCVIFVSMGVVCVVCVCVCVCVCVDIICSLLALVQSLVLSALSWGTGWVLGQGSFLGNSCATFIFYLSIVS
jgi:hypothetical protein